MKQSAAQEGAKLTYYTGFPPATFVANEGLLVSYPARKADAGR
jgi:hypothetical protein